MENQGASVVINHHILNEKLKQYEDWLNEIGPKCRSFPGFIDWQIIRPIAGLTFIYTIIIRFDSIENLKNWMESEERKNLIEKASPLFSGDDKYLIRSGLEFLFDSESEKQKVPPRWKQFLVTWSAIYPLSNLTPLLVLPALRFFNLPENKWLNSFFISGCVVFIMVFWLMPNYTKLIKKWLFK